MCVSWQLKAHTHTHTHTRVCGSLCGCLLQQKVDFGAESVENDKEPNDLQDRQRGERDEEKGKPKHIAARPVLAVAAKDNAPVGIPCVAQRHQRPNQDPHQKKQDGKDRAQTNLERRKGLAQTLYLVKGCQQTQDSRGYLGNAKIKGRIDMTET